MNVIDSLKRNFGFDNFNLGQAEVIHKILASESAAAIFPTGSGKSLCYQLPSIHLPHLTLVVSPLLALISDQLSFLKSKNIPSARIDSTLTYEELKQVQNNIKSGETKVLFISVERFKNERFRQFLGQTKLSMMVVDEAHCISEWGHNFRPDYLKLPQYRKEFNIPQVLLLTATATPKVVEDMKREFDIPNDNITITGFHRSNLHLKVLSVEENKKVNHLVQLLLSNPEQTSIVYVTLQKTAEYVANTLALNNINAIAYHAGLPMAKRETIQQSFMNGETPIIVATIAFGMGIDKSDIRRVIHYDMPKSLENYSQEIGRAGRDNEISECTVLGNLDGIHTLENFVYGDTPELDGIKKVLQSIQKAGSLWEVKLLQLSKETDIRSLPLKTLLVYLETLNIIRPKYSYFSSYRYKNRIEDEEIIGNFKGERQQFIQAILEHSTKARTWSTVDFNVILSHYGTDRKRISSALDYLNEQNWIELEAKQMVESFDVIDMNFDTELLAEEIHNKFVSKENNEINRITNMTSFFSSKECLSKQLALYFGEDNNWDNCGTCSVCVKGQVNLKLTRQLPEINKDEILNDSKVLIDHCKSSPSHTTIARFLCGISSPFLSSNKASKLSGFGKYENYKFKDVQNSITI